MTQEKVTEETMNHPVEENKLPPRQEYHKNRQKQKKTKFSLKYPVVRLLLVFFILLPLSFLGYIYVSMKDDLIADRVSDSKGVEIVNQDKYIEKKEAVPKSDTTSESDSQTEDEETDHNIVEDEKEDTSIQDEPAKEEISETEVTKPNSSTDSSQPATQQTEPLKEDYEIKYHTVQGNETLYRISMKYYGNRDGEKLIKQWNNMNNDQIFAGQKLQIPIKKQ